MFWKIFLKKSKLLKLYNEVTIENKPNADKLKEYLQGKVSDLSLENHVISGDSLDDGELYSMALYKLLHADYLLIDEKAGRRVAKLNQVKIIGSLGVFIEAKKKGILPSLRPHIETLRKSKIHFSNDLLDYALRTVNE
jgi:predicted nucleic acid-binding protein